MRAQGSKIGLSIFGICVFLALWWVGTVLLVPQSGLLARFSPSNAGLALVELVRTGEIWPHLIASITRILVGLAISIPLGLLIGMATGGSRIFEQMTSSVFRFVRMISPLSWIPLAIIIFGIGDAPVYFLLVIASVWPVAVNTAAGIGALDPGWISVGRVLGATRWEMLKTIVWPGIRSHFLTGVGLAVSISWIVLVPAEMLGVDSGLGYFVLDTRERFAYSELVATIIVIGLCGLALDALVRQLLRERRRPASPDTSEQQARTERTEGLLAGEKQ